MNLYNSPINQSIIICRLITAEQKTNCYHRHRQFRLLASSE